ncbi:helix-turn-helix domain-containing protein, partial [Caldibacillus thermolactis]
MINLSVKQTIIKLYLEGTSQRKIAKRTNKSRNTVSKYIKEYEASRQKDTRNLPIAEDILKPPTYKKRVSNKRVLTKEIETIIKGFIKEN